MKMDRAVTESVRGTLNTVSSADSPALPALRDDTRYYGALPLMTSGSWMILFTGHESVTWRTPRRRCAATGRTGPSSGWRGTFTDGQCRTWSSHGTGTTFTSLSIRT